MIDFLSDTNIMNTINSIKSDYFIVTGIVLGIATYIVKKTKNKIDDKILERIKKMMGR